MKVFEIRVFEVAARSDGVDVHVGDGGGVARGDGEGVVFHG